MGLAQLLGLSEAELHHRVANIKKARVREARDRAKLKVMLAKWRAADRAVLKQLERAQKGSKIAKDLRAILVVQDDPGLSNRDIARIVGCDPSLLSKSKNFKLAAYIARQAARRTSPTAKRRKRAKFSAQKSIS